MLNKRGQFFIITAVVLSTIVVGLTATNNYVEASKEPRKFFDLISGLEEEISWVINYETYSGTEKLPDFLDKAISDISNKNPDIELTILYENTIGDVEILIYSNKEDSLNLTIGDWNNIFNIKRNNKNKITTSQKWEAGKEVAIITSDKEAYLTLSSRGERFYIISEKDSSDLLNHENYIQTSSKEIKIKSKKFEE